MICLALAGFVLNMCVAAESAAGIVANASLMS